MRYKTVAYWPQNITLGTHGNTSSDTHRSKEEAEWVAKELMENGFGGEGDTYPLKVEVLPIGETNG